MIKRTCEQCIYEELPYRKTALHKHSYLFFEGDEFTHVYQIMKGYIKVSKIYSNGDEKILDVFGPNEFVALLLALQGKDEYIATAYTLSDVTLRSIKKEDVKTAYVDNPVFQSACMNCAATRVGSFQQQVIQLSESDTTSKIINMVEFLAVKFGSRNNDHTTLNLPIQKADLASLIGIRRETLSRRLHKMKDDGILDFDNNTYYIKQPSNT